MVTTAELWTLFALSHVRVDFEDPGCPYYLPPAAGNFMDPPPEPCYTPSGDASPLINEALTQLVAMRRRGEVGEVTIRRIGAHGRWLEVVADGTLWQRRPLPGRRPMP